MKMRFEDGRCGGIDKYIGWGVKLIDLITAGGRGPFAFAICFIICNGAAT